MNTDLQLPNRNFLHSAIVHITLWTFLGMKIKTKKHLCINIYQCLFPISYATEQNKVRHCHSNIVARKRCRLLRPTKSSRI
jgi:hypothetical protein